MTFALALLLWTAGPAPLAAVTDRPALTVSPEDLARTDALLRGGALVVPAQAPVPALVESPARRESPEPDLAVLVGTRDDGGQFELGALGGGRRDAPGLFHVGVGFDF